ncbi:hypothetical protein GCM10010094_24750 [Streptomyces flaveus]|uniref:Uncharacterized protein n=1 Tax=Streptomyces flaveus TaxID=66370 RepID=A0A917QR31_9ACTN|nr:hypothetical protein GCM10010094_24750 [Streptomyces flaveus]
MARSRSSHDSNPTSDSVAAQYQPEKHGCPRYGVNRRTGSADSNRTRENRLQHGLPQAAALTLGSVYLPKTTVTGTARTGPGNEIKPHVRGKRRRSARDAMRIRQYEREAVRIRQAQCDRTGEVDAVSSAQTRSDNKPASVTTNVLRLNSKVSFSFTQALAQN